MRKASCSAGVGGSPIRSKYTRRSSVILSALPTGVSCFSLYFSAIKASIGFGVALGACGRTTGVRDHNGDSFLAVAGGVVAEVCFLPAFAAVFAGVDALDTSAIHDMVRQAAT